MKLHEALPTVFAGGRATREAWDTDWDNSVRWVRLPEALVNNPIIAGQFMAMAGYLSDGNTVGRESVTMADLVADDWLAESK